jgi:integrase
MFSDGSVSPMYSESELYNYELNEIIQSFRKSALKLGTGRTMNMSCKELRDFIVESIKPTYDLIDFVSFSKEIIEAEKKEKTAEWYNQSLKSFIWFLGKEKIDARDITQQKIRAWIEQLKDSGQSGRPLQNGTISNYVRGLRALYTKCKHRYNKPDFNIILIPNRPFDIDTIPVYKRKRKSITIEKIQMIRDFKAETRWEVMGRDIFMMMFYLMGINIGDLYHLNPPKNGRLEYQRSKTNKENNTENLILSVKIEPELQVLIDKYSPNGFLSGLKAYSKYNNLASAVNKGLKKICESLDIEKVTTNWARHSWASIARNKARVPKADIDFCLGHVNNDYKMADIYIDIDYSICDEAIEKYWIC